MANSSQGRAIAVVFASLLALLLLVIFRPGDQSAAAVELGDPTAWIEHGIDGEVLQISALTGDITSRVEVGEPGDDFAAYPHRDGAVVVNATSGLLSVVSGSELAVTTTVDLPLAEGVESRDLHVFGRPDQVNDLVVIDSEQVIQINSTSGDVSPLALSAPMTSLVQDGRGEIYGLEPVSSSIVQLDPLGLTAIASVTEAIDIDDDQRAVVAGGGMVFALDPERLSLAIVQPEGGLSNPICMRSVAVGAVHGGSGLRDEPIVISLNASSSMLGISAADGTCRDVEIDIDSGEYGTPIAYDGVVYLPFWSEGRILSIDLETGETLSDTAFGTRGQPFELELFGSTVWANERSGPIAAVVREAGIVPVLKVSTVVGTAGGVEAGNGTDSLAAGGGDNDVDGLRIIGDEGDAVMTADTEESDDSTPGLGEATDESAQFGTNDGTEPLQPEAFGIPVDSAAQPEQPDPELDELAPPEPEQPDPEPEIPEPLDQVIPIVEDLEAEQPPVEELDQLLANFTVSAAETTVGEAVLFTDVSTGDPASWSWVFGDGSTAQGPVFDKVWDEPGNYEVTLTVTGVDGQSSTQGTVISVLPADVVLAPNVDFRFSTDTSEVGESITFESTTTGDVDILEWDFGNGRTAVGEEVTHAFDEAGTYEVTLTATNEAGANSNTALVTVLSGVEPPVAAIAPIRRTIVTDQTIRFESVSLNEPTSESWNFGDGTEGSGTVVRHSFAEAGEYRVVLVVQNSEGRDRTIVDVVVEDRVIEPTARFGQSATRVLVGEEVAFSNASLNGPTEFAWSFGDGTVRGSQNPTHSWDAPGTYRVSLRVENSAGSDEAVVNITVEEPIDPPQAAFTVSSSVVAVGQDIMFQDRSTNEPTEWLWEFENSGQVTVQNPFRQWQRAGTYTVRLTASNAGGESTTETEVTVVERPTAAFRIETVTNDTFRFVDLSQNADQWRWDFGDGETSSEQNPTHTFGAGTFTVRLTTTNEAGSSPAAQQTVTVSQPPVARASCEAEGRLLTCSGLDSERAVSYAWSAPGAIVNTTPNQSTTTFQFDTAGAKEVTLRVANAMGETDAQTIRTERVEESQAPRVTNLEIVSFEGELIRLEAEFDGDPDTWEWTFDGATIESGGDGPTPVVRVPENGTYSGSVRVANSIGSDQQPFAFVVDHFDEGPERAPRVLGVEVASIDGDLVTLVAEADRDPETWEWDLNGAVLVSGGDTNMPTFQIPQNGRYLGFVEAANVVGFDRDNIAFTFDNIP